MNNKLLVCWLAIICLLSSADWAMAQANYSQLRGRVIDEEARPLAGVTVTLLSTNQQVLGNMSTDQQGEFIFERVQAGGQYDVRFAMIGYETYVERNLEVKSGSNNSVLVTLNMQMSNMEELVVIGYGQQRRGDLTTAIGSVANVAQQVDRPTTSIGDLLQGNVAGVTVMSSGGDPSSMPTVMIRGMGTMNNESPLYVVDGTPYYGGPINPNDIESIDVLKDAASAAIYGAQAASGVIVITTKSGKSGKPSLGVDLYQGWHTAYNLPSALNAEQYSQAYNQAALHSGNTLEAGHDPAQNPWGQVTRTDWMDEIFRVGKITNFSADISGGSEKARYLSSVGYHNKEGLLLNTDYKRLSYRLKSDFDLSDRIAIGQNFYVNQSESTGTNTSSSYSGSIINAIYMNPAAPVYDEDGLFHGTVPQSLQGFSGIYGDTYNPVALLLRPTVSNPVLNINGNVYGSIKLLEGLDFRSNFALDIQKYSYKRFDPKIPEIGRSNSTNYLNQTEQNTNRWIWDQQLNYTKRFGAHKLDLLGVYSAQKVSFDTYSVQGQDFEREDEWYQYIGNAGRVVELPNSDGVYEEALTSAIARVMYEYGGRYFLSASIRQDRSSRLAKNNRSDVFPSVSGAWKISAEPFFDPSVITDLKIRSSWGQIGNIQSVNAYSYNIPMTTNSHTPLGNGASVRHFAVTQMSNPDLVWERSESFGAGLDVSFLNKINFAADYYRKKTIGMILQIDANVHAGVENGPIVNVGDVLNQGFEFVGTYKDRFGDFNLNVNANVAFNRNKVLHLDNQLNDFIPHGDNVRSVLLPYRSTPGQPLYSYYLIPQDGIFNSQEEVNAHSLNGNLIQENARPGDLRFVDTNGDGRINDDDRIYMGSAIPKFNYGFSAQLGYKAFDLSVLTYGISGSKLFNGYKYTAYNAGMQGYNLDSRVLDAWNENNTNTDIPALSRTDRNNNFGTTSDWYLESGDYFRIKNLTLGYTLPNSLLSGLSSTMDARVYFSAENPLTITSYSGIDPEVGRTGMDVGNYPMARTFSVGININF